MHEKTDMNRMKNFIKKRYFYLLSAVTMACSFLCVSCDRLVPYFVDHEGYTLWYQRGPVLGVAKDSKVEILQERNLVFKDLNKNGIIDIYEDWRKPIEVRARDLAKQMRDKEIAGLMLYSSHMAIENAALTDEQKSYLRDRFIRHLLITTMPAPVEQARWNNNIQAFAESLRLGIPVNNSSDPRHTMQNDAEFIVGGGGEISLWPNELGMAATFDPDLMYHYGEIVSAEYRALGITTALSPQIDLATDPRWMRFNGTYGEDPELVRDMAVAYCEALQTSQWFDKYYNTGVWGPGSVNTMAKHWPGGGVGEAGRDAHYGRGKFAVYPNENLELQKFPFIEGVLKLQQGTKTATAIMPYYTIPWGQTPVNMANNFNKQIIQEQLRNDQEYEGVICTDWGVTADEFHPGIHSGKPWGVEEFAVSERHYMALLAGVDQFGGNDDPQPVLDAFKMIEKMFGTAIMKQRIRRSAERLLLNIFRTGLFENPYLDPAKTALTVGNPEFMKAGYEAQTKSIVMLKNKNNTLPVTDRNMQKVYVPNRILPQRANFFGGYSPADTISPLSDKALNSYFRKVNLPFQSDFAIVFIDSPQTGWGYKASETLNNPLLRKKAIRTMVASGKYPELEGVEDAPIESLLQEDDIYFQPKDEFIPEPANGYYPISLQYSDYVAKEARHKSIAGGDPYEYITNRSYLGKGVRCINKSDMELVMDTRVEMGDKPVIVVINCMNPMVMSEIEPFADAILLTFSVSSNAILDIITGRSEPSALLPFQMPANMATVEHQAEDTPHDMDCYTDEMGNVYNFAFGMNWEGVIKDERYEKYFDDDSADNL